MNHRPNLFTYATSELSQDAFLCWLLAWAAPEMAQSAPQLAAAARRFLKSLLAKAGEALPSDITDVDVKRQFQFVDILVLLNNDLALVIEDKVHTENHSDQLRRYRELVQREYPNCRVACIYLKTGDQSSYRKVTERGFATFTRADLLDVLREGRAEGVENAIYVDFLEHLTAMDQGVNQFRTVPINKWDWQCWIGFFTELQSRLGDGEWGYVANPTGGFMGYWWHWTGTNGKKYLQIEGEFDAKDPSRLCFKIEVENQNEQSQQRNDWYQQLETASSQGTFALSKPKRFGKGRWMTAAVADGEFRRTDAQGVVNIEATVDYLKKAERFLDEVVSHELETGAAE